MAYFRVIERKDGWGIAEARRSLRVPEAFEPVLYLTEGGGVGHVRFVVEMPFKDVYNLRDVMVKDKELGRKLSDAINRMLEVLREINGRYGEKNASETDP